MEMTIEYSGFDTDMEEDLRKTLKKHGWDLDGSGMCLGSGTRDIRFSKEEKKNNGQRTTKKASRKVS
jgi:hypothetical protein